MEGCDVCEVASGCPISLKYGRPPSVTINQEVNIRSMPSKYSVSSLVLRGIPKISLRVFSISDSQDFCIVISYLNLTEFFNECSAK